MKKLSDFVMIDAQNLFHMFSMSFIKSTNKERIEFLLS